MAQQGTSASLGFWTGIENSIATMEYTVPACTLNFIRGQLRDSLANGGHTVRAVVYDSGGNLVAQSATNTGITTAGGTFDFTFTGATLSADTYRFGLISNRSSGDLELSHAFDSPTGFVIAGLSPAVEDQPDGPTPPATASLSADFRNWAVLIDYTEGGSSFSLTVDSASAVGQGQTISSPGTILVEVAQAAAQPFDVQLLFDAAYVLPVTAQHAALEGQEIPFIYSLPGNEGAMAAQGQSVNLIAQASIAVDMGQAAATGQTITLLIASSIVVTAGGAAFATYPIELIATGQPALGDGVMIQRRRRRA